LYKITVFSDEKMCFYISTLDTYKNDPFKSRKSLKLIEQSILKIFQEPIQFHEAIKLPYNVGSYTQRRIVLMYRDQAEKLPERKDAHRKQPLPHLTDS
jgi:hypothetical protein